MEASKSLSQRMTEPQVGLTLFHSYFLPYLKVEYPQAEAREGQNQSDQRRRREYGAPESLSAIPRP